MLILVNFTFGNFRSFRDERILSMEAVSIKELAESVIRKDKYRLLPVAVMYGANSSGKSNVIKAIAIMRHLILNSVKLNPTDTLPFEPFALDLGSKEKSTFFEIQFLLDDVKYRYGFEYNHIQIVSEWLYENPFKVGTKEHRLFERDKGDFNISKNYFEEGRGKETSTPDNRLFLSLVAQLNGEKSDKILAWFKKCHPLSGIDSRGYENFTWEMFDQHKDGCEQAHQFFHRLNLGFNQLMIEEQPFPEEFLAELPKEIRERMNGRTRIIPKTTHNIYNKETGEIVDMKAFEEEKMESAGTQKVVEMSGPIFDTLNDGGVLVIDELDAKLHVMLTRSIVSLFMDPETNFKGAQLIFATHDTHLLNTKYLRRDQIWFTEKDRTEASDLYSLLEFKDENGNKVRNDRDIENDYINGRYGAIPFIN